MLCGGCSLFKPTTIHPITDVDYKIVEDGEHTYHCFSDYYLKEIMDVKIEG